VIPRAVAVLLLCAAALVSLTGNWAATGLCCLAAALLALAGEFR
jgi:hypothetical protein